MTPTAATKPRANHGHAAAERASGTVTPPTGAAELNVAMQILSASTVTVAVRVE